MQGVPKGLLTRADFELLQDMAVAGRLSKSERTALQAHWQGLLNGRYKYDYDKTLSDDDEADGESPEYIVLTSLDESSGDEVRKQYQRVEADVCRMVLLGFTADEVEIKMSVLSELGGVK